MNLPKTNPGESNVSEKPKTQHEIVHEYSLAHPVQTLEDYHRAGSDPRQSKVQQLNNLYLLSVITCIMPGKDVPGRQAWDWHFIASIRLAKSQKPVSLNMLGKNYLRSLKRVVAEAAGDAGDRSTEQIITASHIVRLRRNLTESEMAKAVLPAEQKS